MLSYLKVSLRISKENRARRRREELEQEVAACEGTDTAHEQLSMNLLPRASGTKRAPRPRLLEESSSRSRPNAAARDSASQPRKRRKLTADETPSEATPTESEDKKQDERETPKDSEFTKSELLSLMHELLGPEWDAEMDAKEDAHIDELCARAEKMHNGQSMYLSFVCPCRGIGLQLSCLLRACSHFNEVC